MIGAVCWFLSFAGALVATASDEPNWPFDPADGVYELYQRYGQLRPDRHHAGLDILAKGERVYAIEDGIVRAILTGEEEYNEIVVGTPAGQGWRYTHIEETSIQVVLGDIVSAGDYLGDVATWTDGSYPDHLHLERVGVTQSEPDDLPWEDFEAIDNPLLLLHPLHDKSPPVIKGPLLFIAQGDLYGNALSVIKAGVPVDVVVRIHDCYGKKKKWKLAPLDLLLEIVEVGPEDPSQFGEPTTWHVRFEGPIEGGEMHEVLFQYHGAAQSSSQDGQRIFAYILTNTNGDSVWDCNDSLQAWTPEQSGTYRLRVAVEDAVNEPVEIIREVTVVE